MEAVTGGEKALLREHPSAASSDIAALGELYDQHANAVYQFLVAMLGSPSDAEDVLSEVFLEVSRRGCKLIRSPRAYLLASGRNRAISALRRRRREVATDPADPRLLSTLTPGPDQVLLAGQIELALSTLTPEQREVVVLKVCEELTFVEIARITRTRPNTVAGRYRYALEKLRKELKEHRDE